MLPEKFGLWDLPTFSTVQHISCLNVQGLLASCTQSIATAGIFVYSTKTMNSTVEVKNNWDLHKRYKAERVYHVYLLYFLCVFVVLLMCICCTSYVYLLYFLCVFVVSYVYLLYFLCVFVVLLMCICCTSYAYLLYFLCVFVVSYVYLLCYVYCCSYFRCRTAG
jgi:hypothetical protein